MFKNVTLKEVAEKAKVSIGTVDRALNNRGRVSIDTRNRVLKVAKELGYQPNVMARALSTDKEYKILAMVPKMPSYFFDVVYKGMQNAASELEKYRIQVIFYRQNKVNEISVSDLTKAISNQNYNGVVLIPTQDMRNMINELSGKIPVITYNCDIPNTSRLCYFGQNTYKAGRIAGELIGKFLSGQGNVLVLHSDKRVEAMEQRKQGFLDIICEDYQNIRILNIEEYFESEELAIKFVEKYRTKKVDGLFATSEVGTVGAAMALKKYKFDNSPALVGFDTGDVIEEALLDGRVTATLNQDPFGQGYYSIMYMGRLLLLGKPPERELYHTKTSVILKDSIDEVVDITFKMN